MRSVRSDGNGDTQASPGKLLTHRSTVFEVDRRQQPAVLVPSFRVVDQPDLGAIWHQIVRKGRCLRAEAFHWSSGILSLGRVDVQEPDVLLAAMNIDHQRVAVNSSYDNVGVARTGKR